MKSINEIKKELESKQGRSAWDKGVTLYALELIEKLDLDIFHGYVNVDDLESESLLERVMLSGASNWSEYSWSGRAQIYNSRIAKRLCAPYELKKTRNGERKPNAREDWLDVQTRALSQATARIKAIAFDAR